MKITENIFLDNVV